MEDWYTYPNRTICSMLEEMRSCFKTYHFAPIAGLIEEVQSAANRMEAALEDQTDLRRARKDLNDLRETIKVLRAKKEALEKEVGDDTP